MSETEIGFLVFPGMLQLDFTGAYGVLAAGPETRIHLMWKDKNHVLSSDGLAFAPTITLHDCPQLDVLCVPGGAGILSLLEDGEVLDFLRRQAPGAAYVSSVCTGTLVLGAAGLLRGFKAATHWSSTSLLAPFHASYVPQRVVVDGNRITAAGVTSGIDMALTLASLLWGETMAQTIALNMEYAPEPPFMAGSPHTAPVAVVNALREKNSQRQKAREEAVQRAAARLDTLQ